MGKTVEKILDHPIRSAILISSILGGIAGVIGQIEKLKK